MPNTSPSGSQCPYYYKGGELHPLKYGSFFSNMEALSKIIDLEEKYILKSAGNRRIWIDLYDSYLTDEIVEKFVNHILAIHSKIHKLALVGCSKTITRKINGSVKKTDSDLFNEIRYFNDPEDAKNWLISEN